MRIKRITLKEYKRFKSLTIDLGDEPKRIIALVGPNGCGKSSIFDGILFHNNAYKQIGNKGNKDFICFCHSTSFSNSSSSCSRKFRQMASTKFPNWPLLQPESGTRLAIMPHDSFQLRSGY